MNIQITTIREDHLKAVRKLIEQAKALAFGNRNKLEPFLQECGLVITPLYPAGHAFITRFNELTFHPTENPDDLTQVDAAWHSGINAALNLLTEIEEDLTKRQELKGAASRVNQAIAEHDKEEEVSSKVLRIINQKIQSIFHPPKS